MQTRNTLAALVALMLAVSGVAAFAAMPAAAWETGSDVTGSTTSLSVDTAGNGTITLAVNESTAPSASDVKFVVRGVDEANKNTVLTNVIVAKNASAVHDSANAEYEATIDESNLGDAPGVNGQYDVKFVALDVSGTDPVVIDSQVVDIGDAQQNRTNVHIGVEHNNSNFVGEYSPAVADSANVSTTTQGGFFGIGGESVDQLSADGWTEINGDNSTVYMRLHGDDAQAVADAASNVNDGELVPVMLQMNGKPVLVFAGSAPDYMDGHTYGVYDNSTDTITVHVGKEHADANTVSYKLTSHIEPGFGALNDYMSTLDAVTESFDDRVPMMG